MLLYLIDNNKIVGYNELISKEEAQEHVLNGAVWADDLVIDIPNDGEYDIYYVDGNVEYVKRELIEEVEELTEHELIAKETYETTSMSAEDNLLNMDLLTSLDDKLNLIMEHLGLC